MIRSTIFFIISLILSCYSKDVESLNSLMTNVNSDSTFVDISEQSKSKSKTIFTIQYGFGNKNLYADEFDEIKFYLQYKYDYGSVGFFWAYLNNKHSGSNYNNIYDESFPFKYDIGNFGVLFELNEKYYGAGFSLSYFTIGKRGSNLSESEENALPKIWLNIGLIKKYYFTIGYVDYIPLKKNDGYLSIGVTYLFYDSISKITLRKIGINNSGGIAFESEFRIIYKFLLNSELQYYFELENNNKEIQKDIHYLKIGIGYIF